MNFQKAGDTLAEVWSSNKTIDAYETVARFIDTNTSDSEPTELQGPDMEWHGTLM